MDIDLDKAIYYSLKIMPQFSMINTFSEYSKGYFGSTELVGKYLAEIDFKTERALTVLASGDQAFNLILKGVKNIDTFDINKLQYFVFCLKRAMFLKLDYDEYKKRVYTFGEYDSLDKSLELLEDLKECLEEKVYLYFRTLLEYIKKNRFHRFGNLFTPINYLYTDTTIKSEDNFLKVKEGLQDAKFSFTFGNAIDVPRVLKPGYDIILLSNIADYLADFKPDFGISDFNSYIKSYYDLLNPEGVVINYLYNSSSFPICNTDITVAQLGKDNIHCLTENEGGEGYYLIRKR